MQWQDLKKSDRIELIQEFWINDCSAETLAQNLSRFTRSTVSRHAIIGIYNRNHAMRLSHPLGGGGHKNKQRLRDEQGNPVLRQRTPRRKANPRPPIQETPPPLREGRKVKVSPEALTYDASSFHLVLEQVAVGMCHWPVGNPEPGGKHHFCGHDTAEDQRYCPHHKDRSVRRSRHG